MDFFKKYINRRQALFFSVSAIAAATVLFIREKIFLHKKEGVNGENMNVIKQQFDLDFQWPTQEPFLFCVHHFDYYPRGTAEFGPEASLLKGRNIGMDFDAKEGFRMYHGEVVPGFPVHPHRGFETVTIVRKGLVDHADSLGAAGRYGEGDVQWMTAGAGVQHSEMFPLLKQDAENTVELFQIWLNLPRRSKMVAPHFKMFWANEIPSQDLHEGKVKVSVIAGKFAGQAALSPPPDSWASDPNNEVMILLFKMEESGKLTLPASAGPTNRTLYFFEGDKISVNQIEVGRKKGLVLDSAGAVEIVAVNGPAQILVLQAKPIGEPTVQHGPFVMNSKEEIMRTIEDYRRTEFGGWRWPRHDMVHGPGLERFARYPDGRVEKPKV